MLSNNNSIPDFHTGFTGEEQELAKEYCRYHMAKILGLVPDEHDGLICPICGSGSGPHGTGMTTQDDVHYRCWSCGETRDVYDMAEAMENANILHLDGCNIFDKVYRRAGLYNLTSEQRQALYNEDYDGVNLPAVKPSTTSPPIKPKKVASSTPVEIPDYTGRYKKASDALWSPTGNAARDYLKSRGLSDETMKKFHIGYVPPRYCGRLFVPVAGVDASMSDYPVFNGWIDTTNGKGAILIPVSADCYVLRNLNKASFKRYAKYTAKGNPFKVTYEHLLYCNCREIYIVEGYVDMLSVAEVGRPSIAIGTTGAPSDLQNAIKRAYDAGRLNNTTLVICEDNDAPGQNGLKKIKAFLNTLVGVKYTCCDPCAGISDANGHPLKDANDALVNNREKFLDNLKNALKQPITTVTQAKEIPDNLAIADDSQDSYDYDDPDVDHVFDIAENSPANTADVDDAVVTATSANTEVADINSLFAANNSDTTSSVEATSSSSQTGNMLIRPLAERLDAFEHDDGTRYLPISTGLKKLDRILGGGLRTGLTGLQALSGTGKSTVALQICDNIAERGIPVLYVSLEMSINDILSKDIARVMWLKQIYKGSISPTPIKKSSVDILTRAATYDYWTHDEKRLFEASFEHYRSISQNLYIVEGGMVSTPEAVHTVDRIEKCMQAIYELTGQYPVVSVDYLQKLKGATIDSCRKNLTEKQIIDESVYNLRQLATKYSVPIIAILSMNRQSYGQGVSLNSAKGSGDIEYSVDVLVGMQRPKDDTTTEDQDTANSEQGLSQTVEFKIIKNRYGTKGSSDQLRFFGKQCCFLDDEPEIDYTLVPGEVVTEIIEEVSQIKDVEDLPY